MKAFEIQLDSGRRVAKAGFSIYKYACLKAGILHLHEVVLIGLPLPCCLLGLSDMVGLTGSFAVRFLGRKSCWKVRRENLWALLR